MKARQLDDIKAETDSTDHLAFICPDCGVRMNVNNISTGGHPRKVTYVFLECGNCKGTGYRKFYWQHIDLSQVPDYSTT